MASVPVVHHWRHAPLSAPQDILEDVSLPRAPVVSPAGQIQVVGIAASTGGPAALAAILRHLPASYPLPILVVQHVSRGFVAALAEWLNAECHLQVGVANHGDPLQPGTVLLAPDDYHLQINACAVLELCHEPPYRGLRPSANYLFRSLACAFGPLALGIVLTGMGDDGADGLKALKLSGGMTIAQEEASCVVYGMPREAVAAGAVDQILSPEEIAQVLNRLATQQPSGKDLAHD